MGECYEAYVIVGGCFGEREREGDIERERRHGEGGCGERESLKCRGERETESGWRWEYNGGSCTGRRTNRESVGVDRPNAAPAPLTLLLWGFSQSSCFDPETVGTVCVCVCVCVCVPVCCVWRSSCLL